MAVENNFDRISFKNRDRFLPLPCCDHRNCSYHDQFNTSEYTTFGNLVYFWVFFQNRVFTLFSPETKQAVIGIKHYSEKFLKPLVTCRVHCIRLSIQLLFTHFPFKYYPLMVEITSNKYVRCHRSEEWVGKE